MSKKSTFQRLTKLEKGLPKAGQRFLKDSNFKNAGGLQAAWIQGDFKNPKNFVMVFQNKETGGYDILSKVDGEFVVESQPNLYQTFLTHKELRFR